MRAVRVDGTPQAGCEGPPPFFAPLTTPGLPIFPLMSQDGLVRLRTWHSSEFKGLKCMMIKACGFIAIGTHCNRHKRVRLMLAVSRSGVGEKGEDGGEDLPYLWTGEKFFYMSP